MRYTEYDKNKRATKKTDTTPAATPAAATPAASIPAANAATVAEAANAYTAPMANAAMDGYIGRFSRFSYGRDSSRCRSYGGGGFQIIRTKKKNTNPNEEKKGRDSSNYEVGYSSTY